MMFPSTSLEECQNNPYCSCDRHHDHSQLTQPSTMESQFDDKFWHASPAIDSPDHAKDMTSDFMMETLSPFNMVGKDQLEGYNNWHPTPPMSPFGDSSHLMNQIAPVASHGSLDPQTTTVNSDWNTEFQPNFSSDSLIPTPSFPCDAEFGENFISHPSMEYPDGSNNSLGQEGFSALSGYASNNHHAASHAVSTSVNFGDLSSASLNPPLESTEPSCLAQNLPSCLSIATKGLRTLHVRQTSCLSRGSQDATNTDPPRMSGSVLKETKDVGMSVCRMMQCACILRPQNQLLIATICSRLVVWYRAMIHADFPHMSGMENIVSGPERVAHQAVTIGDHTVDNPSLGLNIQAQVMLNELGHLQRLVNTLLVRIQQTGELHSMGGSQDSSKPGRLPDFARDRLVEHLLKEVQGTKDYLSAVLNPRL